MQSDYLDDIYSSYKERALSGRYIHNDSITPLLEKSLLQPFTKIAGKSVNSENIYSITIGQGPKKLLMWSQMHGNESTTTKAVFDLINVLLSSNEKTKNILESCTLVIIPILNPDGAKRYTRLNANDIDLNRDAQDLSQPESKILRKIYDEFKPDLCFNLHGQRTIYSAGNTDKPATLSFLSPAQDADLLVTSTRKKAMDCIVIMKNYFESRLPGMIGRYDDSFNLNCVGDTFQSQNTATVLFEAGHYKDDYDREAVRKFVFEALMVGIQYFASSQLNENNFSSYFDIPENQKKFLDIIIRNTSLGDIGIQYDERLIGKSIEFIPKIEKISNLSSYYGHKEINANENEVFNPNSVPLKVGNEIDFVLINNEKFSLKLKKN